MIDNIEYKNYGCNRILGGNAVNHGYNYGEIISGSVRDSGTGNGSISAGDAVNEGINCNTIKGIDINNEEHNLREMICLSIITRDQQDYLSIENDIINTRNSHDLQKQYLITSKI